jgi:hypothetical protein
MSQMKVSEVTSPHPSKEKKICMKVVVIKCTCVIYNVMLYNNVQTLSPGK